MKFTKLAKSEKFEYMMLSRLIQDAKYFIEHPDLKHLWARTLDEHIKQMKEQYTKLDPKPEWTSEEEINNLAKQMKESYTNHWNEVHPDNKIEASDNFKVGDKVFFDTLYEFQEDDLGFNYNRGILKEIKHCPYNNREYYIVQTDDGKLLEVGHIFHTEEEADAFRNNWMNHKFEKESAITQPNKPKPTTMLPDNMQWAWDPDAADWVAVLKDNTNTTPPLYDPNNQNVTNNNATTYMSTVKSSENFDEENLNNIWIVDMWLDNMDSEDGHDTIEFTKIGLIDWLNSEIESYGSTNDVEVEHIPEDATNERLKQELSDWFEAKVVDIQPPYNKRNATNKSLSVLPKLLDKVWYDYDEETAGKYAQIGSWEIGLGGYDTGYEVSYNGTPIFSITEDNELKPYMSDDRLQKDFGFSYSDVEKALKKHRDLENIKIASVIDGEEDENPLSVKLSDLFLSDSSLVDSYIKKEIGCNDIINILGIKIKNENEYKEVCNYVNEFINDNYMNNIKSSCLAKFLDGPQFSKEIKIEAGLIKEGLVKYAGFDFNRGTKYTITTKGLQVLRNASEKEHNEALNEREKLAYMFGFNTDKETTLDTTGKVIKSDELSKCEWCGEEFDESELEDTELGKVCYRCKKGIESKEGPMNNKNISEAKQYLEKYLLENPELFKYQYGKDNVEEVLKELVEENPNWYKKFSSKKWTICEADGTELGEVEADSELDAKVKFSIEHPEYAESLSISAKEIDAKYEETAESHEPYPNPSETPNNHITLENHDGWVNTAEQKVTPEFAKLHSILGEYKKNGHILSITQDGKDLLVSCSPIASYEMKQKIEQLGYECEETDESETGDVYDLPSYTLRIKMK